MTKKQLISIIEAMEDSSRIISHDENISEKMRTKATAEMLAYSTVANMLKNPKYAKELAEIYEVAI